MQTLSRRRRSMPSKRSLRLVEQLESRVLLSANISAYVSNGLLYVQGDNANDSVVIDQAALSASQFRVASGDGMTTVNGQSAAMIFSGVTGVVISTGYGNDTIALQNATIGANLQVTGLANLAVTLSNVEVTGNFTLAGGGGQNSTDLENSVVGGSVSVNVGAGFSGQCGNFWCTKSFANANEIFTMNLATVGANVSITNASGETTTSINASSIGGSVTVNNGGNNYGTCGFNFGCKHTGAGYSTAGDLFTMTGSSVTGDVAVANASDGNNTDIEGTTINGNLSVSNNVTVKGSCGFNVCGGGNYAGASDAFTFNGGSVGGNLSLANVSDGATATLVDASIGGNLTINNGVGTYGQGYTTCAGATTTQGADSFSASLSSVTGNVSINNGSTYNVTAFDNSFINGSLTVSDGLNWCPPSYYSYCGQTSACGQHSGCGGGSTVYTTDLFTMTDGSTVLGNVSVTNASGYTATTIDSSTIIANVTITDASGTNYFTLTNSTITGNLTFIAGKGLTDVTLTASSVGSGTITVASNATVTIDPVTTADSGTIVVN